MPSAAPPVQSGIAPLIPKYDLLLCDVWGVVHNGETAYPDAVDALHRARDAGSTVILITNAPRPGTVIEHQIEGYKVPRSCFDTIVASGDVTREELKRWPGVKLFHLGPERDLPNYEGLDLSLVAFDEAEMIVCTGLFDDNVETPDDYRDMLARIHARKLPFVCANPDIVVERGDRLLWCAGALAQVFETMGGKVIYAGKPHAPVYDVALARAAEIRGAAVARDRVLAIGDGLRTDIAGAAGQGFDSIFVAAGIHAAELAIEGGILRDPAAAERMFAEAGATPSGIIEKLVW